MTGDDGDWRGTIPYLAYPHHLLNPHISFPSSSDAYRLIQVEPSCCSTPMMIRATVCSCRSPWQSTVRSA